MEFVSLVFIRNSGGGYEKKETPGVVFRYLFEIQPGNKDKSGVFFQVADAFEREYLKTAAPVQSWKLLVYPHITFFHSS